MVKNSIRIGFFAVFLCLFGSAGWLCARGFANVRGGVPHAVQDLADQIKNRAYYDRLNARFPKGILFTGKPGVGKTLLARALSEEVNGYFWSYAAPEFNNMWVGESEKIVRTIFNAAKRQACAQRPVIIFIDEIDSLGSREGAVGYEAKLINQLLTCMDGFDKQSNIIVIAATNFPERLDPAMQRSGRFDVIIEIPEPAVAARADIFAYYVNQHPHDASLDAAFFDGVARLTEGFVGADLENLVNQAAINAAQEHATMLKRSHFKRPYQELMQKKEMEWQDEQKRHRFSVVESQGFTVIEPQKEKMRKKQEKQSLAVFLFDQGHVCVEQEALVRGESPEADLVANDTREVCQGPTDQAPAAVTHSYTSKSLRNHSLQHVAWLAGGLFIGWMFDRAERPVYDTVVRLATYGYEPASPLWFGGHRWKLFGGIFGIGCSLWSAKETR